MKVSRQFTSKDQDVFTGSPVHPEPGHSEPDRTKPDRTEPDRTEQAPTEQAQPEQAHAEHPPPVGMEWTTRTSRITNADGSVVFEMTDAEVPSSWSQLATDIIVSKYFRKTGVPQMDANGAPDVDDDGDLMTGPERSARQVVERLAGCWQHWGEEHGYFDTADDARAFHDELAYMLLNQVAAPNSPQWFNTGLNWKYGITGPPQGHWVNDPKTGEPSLADDAYTHPQPHACFIQSISDDLVNEGGIMDLWVREARLFKYGSGTGTNFSPLRSEDEKLSGGGRSSGLMSFLKIGDRAAGAIKSGGTTRRAAKMVSLDADHPDIESFVNWKVREELKVAALVTGLKHLPESEQKVAERLGLKLDYDFNGEAYYTVSGQNSNNSVRLTDAFFEAVEHDDDWELTARTDGSVLKTLKARSLWDQISYATWRSADPGLQYDTTINAWHTCPADGRINASNPCSEYMFLDNTACNLASLNLLAFYNAETRVFDLARFEHAVELWTMVLEISVLMAAFPSEEIARQSFRYRTLGLGFANLGAMLMQAGIPYDSEEGRAIGATITSILTGRSYATSALMAAEHGAFAGFSENREPMLRVIRNHQRAAYGVARDSDDYESLSIRPVPIDHTLFRRGGINLGNSMDLLEHATRAWDDALAWGERYGYRNAQTTVIAPTGTIGLVMDCDTTGVEPDFALVKFKKLAGGGYFKIANGSLRPALAALGYSEEQRDSILRYVMGSLRLDVPMPAISDTAADGGAEDKGGAPSDAARTSEAKTFRDFLESHGYRSEDLVTLENILPTLFELPFAFNAWTMPEAVLRNLGVDPEQARKDTSFDGLHALGLTTDVIETLNRTICGAQTVEGAPHIEEQHLAVFDCANTCGKTGRRFIATEGHIRMMAAVQPFISGAISKTINLPNDARVEHIAAAYWLSWELGLKANALYRDGSKLSQPLNTKTDSKADQEADADTDYKAGTASEEKAPSTTYIERVVERVVERVIEKPMRRRLADTRESLTHRFNVAGHEGYLTVGLYADRTPGELFITMSKEGSTIGGLMDSLGTAISVALQYGVPLESLVTKFAHQRFEPMGMTANRDIPLAKSLVDYIFRWLGMEFIAGYREANAPVRTQTDKQAPAVEAAAPAETQATTTTTPDTVTTEGNDTTTTVTEDKRWSEPGSGGQPQAVGGVDDDRAKTGGSRLTLGSAREGTGPSPRSTTPAGSSAGVQDETQTATQASQAREEAAIAANVGPTPVADASSEPTTDSWSDAAVLRSLDVSHAAMQSDAPACDVCGAITVRSGTCYKCLNCGNSMGCS